MRYVSLKDAKPGMCLAYTLFDSYGRILVGNNGELNSYSIDKLKEYGFDGIYINDELSEDIVIESVITPTLRTKGLAAVRDVDIEECQNIAKMIVEEILEKKSVSFDLTDLRTFDEYTYAHSVNVAIFSCVIGMGMGLAENDIEMLVTAAILHDLGKLLIRAEILNKPGRLTQEEYQIMKSHAFRSYEMIKDRWDLSAHIKTAVLYHHENEDGSGYPDGIEGNKLHIFAKIIHVADVYDALISKRPYKEPYSPHEATEYLMGGCGILFNKEVVETLLRYVPLYPKGTQVILSDGRIGIIYDNDGIHNLRPVVRLFDKSMIDLAERENMGITLRSYHDNTELSIDDENNRNEMVKKFTRYKVMVVDDMVSNLQMLREILENLYDVILLKSGHQAITYLKKYEYPDLILMDIEMPEMDGIETSMEIMKMTENKVPIMFVTAIANRKTVVKCRAMNAAGYVLRPYNPVYIKSEIKRIINGRSEAE